MPPPGIALDVRHIRDYGIGSYIRNLTLALGRRKDDFRYFLVGRPQELRELPAIDERFQKCAFPRSDSGALNQFTFPMFLRQFSLSLTHIPLNAVPVFLQKPYVVTVHDMSSLLYQDSAQAGFRRSYRLMRFRRGLTRANRVITVSQSTLADVESLLGVSSDRLRLIYQAVDPKFLAPLPPADARSAGPQAADFYKRQLLERYQIRDPYLLYAGTIRPQKNIPKLIEAFAVVHSELANHPVYKNLKLLVIGDELSKHPEVRRAVVQGHLEGAVRFFGFVSFDALRMFYEGAEAFVFPSLYEGFGLPPLEAMACGTAVITSNVSSLPEVVGDAAELVNPENVFDIVRGMRDVLLKEDYRQQLVDRGRLRVQKFSWDETARRVVEVYEEVISERRRSLSKRGA